MSIMCLFTKKTYACTMQMPGAMQSESPTENGKKAEG